MDVLVDEDCTSTVARIPTIKPLEKRLSSCTTPAWVQCTEYTQPILSFRTFIEKNNTFLGAVVFLRGQKTKKKSHQLQIWSQHQKLESQQFHLHILSICCHVSVSPLPGPKGQAFFQKKTGTCNGIVRNAEEHPGTFTSQSLV